MLVQVLLCWWSCPGRTEVLQISGVTLLVWAYFIPCSLPCNKTSQYMLPDIVQKTDKSVGLYQKFGFKTSMSTWYAFHCKVLGFWEAKSRGIAGPLFVSKTLSIITGSDGSLQSSLQHASHICIRPKRLPNSWFVLAPSFVIRGIASESGPRPI